MDKPFANANVPLNSTLGVKASGGAASAQRSFVATGTFEFPDGSRETWTHSDLASGLARVLKMPGSHVGRVDVRFIRSSTVRLQMQLRDSNGSTVDAYDESITKASDFERTAILLVVRSGADAAMGVTAGKPVKKTNKEASSKAR